MNTATIAINATGAGLTSFAMPFDCHVLFVAADATQTNGCCVSLSGISKPSSGFVGAERTVLGVLTSATLPLQELRHKVQRGQLLFLDVKVAATFNIVCELDDE